RAKALVERLDIALDGEAGLQPHIYQLHSAIAEEIAKTVNEAISKQAAVKPSGGNAAEVALEGQARVIADKSTNKLIVMSSRRDFLALSDVIKELDVPRRQ